MIDRIKLASDEAEKAVIVGLACHIFGQEDNSSEESLDELAALVETAGGTVVARALQTRQAPEPKSFIGDGKAREIAKIAKQNDAELIVFDNELSPSQYKALEEITDCRILDRSGLILDIFAGRAKTAEGKLQVELAQYKYILPRLTGMWGHLVGQTAAGGKSPIGTRGPGETQLETDRRRVREHMLKLESELREMRRMRETQRRRRSKNEIPVVALVGYTNAGKSTLLNLLTGSEIEANNRLFDTLDTTTRRMKLLNKNEILLSDTVGFIRRLPTHLIEAFKATLEELEFADLIIHVVDISNPEWMTQAQVTEKLCTEIAGDKTERIVVLNKADICPPDEIPPTGLLVSARTGENIKALLELIEKKLSEGKYRAEFVLPFEKGSVSASLHRDAEIISEEYTENGSHIVAVVDEKLFGMFREYVVSYERL